MSRAPKTSDPARDFTWSERRFRDDENATIWSAHLGPYVSVTVKRRMAAPGTCRPPGTYLEGFEAILHGGTTIIAEGATAEEAMERAEETLRERLRTTFSAARARWNAGK